MSINMGYEVIPDKYNFDSKFDTYIIAYCPDTLEWFITNERFFYFEYEKEFKTENEAKDFFEESLNEIYKIQTEITEYIPSFAKNKLFLCRNKDTCNTYCI